MLGVREGGIANLGVLGIIYFLTHALQFVVGSIIFFLSVVVSSVVFFSRQKRSFVADVDGCWSSSWIFRICSVFQLDLCKPLLLGSNLLGTLSNLIINLAKGIEIWYDWLSKWIEIFMSRCQLKFGSRSEISALKLSDTF